MSQPPTRSPRSTDNEIELTGVGLYDLILIRVYPPLRPTAPFDTTILATQLAGQIHLLTGQATKNTHTYHETLSRARWREIPYPSVLRLNFLPRTCSTRDNTADVRRARSRPSDWSSEEEYSHIPRDSLARARSREIPYPKSTTPHKRSKADGDTKYIPRAENTQYPISQPTTPASTHERVRASSPACSSASGRGNTSYTYTPLPVESHFQNIIPPENPSPLLPRIPNELPSLETAPRSGGGPVRAQS
ncbi:hypothetical protein B0T21DRAFT_14083 [Apiosordaria backusii]|uniref:Uncharacterized protein n=1 Tax=Apiosordaria backusii TaxID=314023 RepID=A0AA40EYM6_9PEZI|nr:hypothetical protein B0T21DRAFT_14083 [Apiosordaria backusii]